MSPAAARRAAPRRSFCSVALVVALSLLLLHAADTELRPRYNGYFHFERATPRSLAAARNTPDRRRRALGKLKRIIIDEYVTWHAATLQAVRDGSAADVRTLIFVGNRGRHGLGDRIRGILHAYFCALLSQRLFLIEWNEPFPLDKVFIPGIATNFTYDPLLFGPKTLPDGTLEEQSQIAVSWLDDISNLLTGEKRIVFAVETQPQWKKLLHEVPEHYPDLPFSRKVLEIMPLKREPLAPEFFTLLFRALFRPSPALRKMISEPIDTHNRFSIARLWKRGPLRRIDMSLPFLSIHARLGKGVGEDKKRFAMETRGFTMRSTADCMAKRAHFFARRRGLDPPRFYIATDTIEFRKYLKRALKRLDRRSKVMFGSWEVKHVKDLKAGVKGDLRKYMYTFMDIFVLSHGDAILYFRSGFADLAIWMGGIRVREVFSYKVCS